MSRLSKTTCPGTSFSKSAPSKRLLQQDLYWQDITLPMLENMRKRLRDLVKFIDKKQRKIIYTDFEDELSDAREISLDGMVSATNLLQYKKKMMSFLMTHENHIVLHKLKHNVPITQTDIEELKRLLFETGDVGTREDFERVYGKQEHLGLFIRSLVGLNREAAKKAFSDYLNEHRFNSTQNTIHQSNHRLSQSKRRD